MKTGTIRKPNGNTAFKSPVQKMGDFVRLNASYSKAINENEGIGNAKMSELWPIRK